ncbi:MAG TPA: tRNA epoxyqueuosine(34) reductase QueG [Candidatus Saccharimonadales bacterium]|nr:tRNA epoxyqueuosine(34) reductase QueG [Candidatus Saccharimonadales bacterium]
MKEEIRKRARELGFDACRMTSAEPPVSAPHFKKWLSNKQHGEMSWLERNAHKRVDPQMVLPGAKSLLALAAAYPQGENAPSVNEPRRHGIVARYARFADYHDVLAEKLKQLTAYLNQLGGEGTRSLWYVDTGPILERDLAQRAGLGFIGKHTNLISRELGNWFFISEILTTVGLEPDSPEKNRCGSCTRCLTACPTFAITAPFQLDATKCIAYLTIELRHAIGNRIYGCDDCLAACPWNRFAQEGTLMKQHARPELGVPDLLQLLSLDEEGFKKQFAGTPMLRTKRRGLLRNVCVALGNVGDETALPALQTAAQDGETLIAEHARWAIEEINKRRGNLPDHQTATASAENIFSSNSP